MSLSPLKQPHAIRKTTLRIVPENAARKAITRKATDRKPAVRKEIAYKSVTPLAAQSVTQERHTLEQAISSKISPKIATADTLHLQPKDQPSAFSSALISEATRSQQNSSLHSIEVPLCELPNNELVIRCQDQARKDRPAFEELVGRYQRYVDKLLYHLASDWSDRADLAQEVWIRVYRSIHRLKEPAKFKSWLGRITTNLFYDELRKRKRYKGSVSLDAPRYSSDGQYDWELPSGDPTPADTMMTQEFHEHLKTAMSELPDVFQKTIEMRELQGLSYDEIANLTGVSLGTVKSRIARARQRLQEKLNVYLTPDKGAKRQ